jgi:hypothetical protein
MDVRVESHDGRIHVWVGPMAIDLPDELYWRYVLMEIAEALPRAAHRLAVESTDGWAG